MKKCVSYLGKAIDVLSDAGIVISAAIIIAMSVSIIYEICLRLFIGRGTIWVTECCTLALVAVTFFGAAYVQKRKANINMDLLSSQLKGKMAIFMEGFAYLLTAVFMILFCISAWKMVAAAVNLGQKTNSSIRVPLWIPYVSMFLGALLLVLQLCKDVVKKVNEFIVYQNDTEKNPVKNWIMLFVIAALVFGGFAVFQIGGNWRALGFIMILFGMLFTGIPVFSVLLAVGCAGFIMMRNFSVGLAQLGTLTYGGVNSFTLCALPLFIFAGGLFAASGMIGKLFNFCEGALHFLPGNLAIATILTCAVFAALSGSSVATAATVGVIAIPEMIRRGYDPKIACGAVAAAGTLGSMIPPSNQFIIYAVLTDTSVGQLFMGGIVPGILMALLFATYVFLRCRKNEQLKQAAKQHQNSNVGRLFVESLPVLFGPILILGGIYAGVFTPTESAAFAVLYGFFLCFLSKKFSIRNGKDIVLNASKTSVTILLIVGAATTFGGSITLLQIAQKFSQFVLSAGLSKWAVFGSIAVLTLILGCLMDGIALTMIVVPICFAAITSLGFSPVWFGVVFCLLMEIGLVTPPVGMTLYTVKSITPEVNLATVIKGGLPFLGIMVLTVLILCVFQRIVLWLPSIMF